MLFGKKPDDKSRSTDGYTPEDILLALKDVKDPELHKGLVELGMIKDVKVCGGTVGFTVVLTTPACPLKATIEKDCKAAVMALPGIEQVNVAWDSMVPKARQREQQSIPGVKHVIAVASGKGGVGKSTVSVNLAAALAATGAKTGLLDCDIYGPSLPTLLGIEHTPLVVELPNPETGEPEKKMLAATKYGLRLMSLGFLAPGDAVVMWRGPMVASAVRQMLLDTYWEDLDYLVVDLPPGTGDAQMSLAQLVPLTGVAVVITPQDLAMNIATKALRMFETLKAPILGIVENMATFVCPYCEKESDIFGYSGAGERQAAELGVRFLGRVPLDPRIVADSDEGTPTFIAAPDSRPAEVYRHIASQVAAEISVQTLQKKPESQPIELILNPGN